MISIKNEIQLFVILIDVDQTTMMVLAISAASLHIVFSFNTTTTIKNIQ